MSESQNPVKNTTDQSFEHDVLSASGIKLVDFWAPWCGPCKTLSPVIESLAAEYQGQVEVQKMNVDDNPATPAEYQIRGLPTVLVFKDGELVDRIVGAVPREVLQQSIEKHLYQN